MSEPNQPYWLSWILPMIAVLGVLRVFVKKIFTSAVREQMNVMHAENQTRLQEIDGRLARIEGRMQERWGDYREDGR